MKTDRHAATGGNEEHTDLAMTVVVSSFIVGVVAAQFINETVRTLLLCIVLTGIGALIRRLFGRPIGGLVAGLPISVSIGAATETRVTKQCVAVYNNKMV